jgi:FlaA1/EpsC-like NDP-sugar epimerase/EAL domain-containing protein (putative c-di-GMP-specific phosphodiesterase class I)
MISKLDRKLLNLNNRHFLILDTIVFLITPLLSIVLRLDSFASLEHYKYGIILATILFTLVKLTIFAAFGFYQRYWRYASIDELIQIAVQTAVAILIEILILSIFDYIIASPMNSVPRSLPLLDGIISFILVGGIRFSIRATERNYQKKKKKFYRRDRVLIVGAGDAGVSLLQEMQRNPQLGLYPVAFIDDDPKKLNLQIRGMTVVGNRYQIPEIIASWNIRQVIIAMPTAPGRVIREIVDVCQALGIKTSTLPGIHEILNYRVSLNSVREVKIEDLLRREPIQTDTEKVFKLIAGKRVLITGAGGSIGSELCRQIFRCNPAMMILVGHGENSVFNIEQELGQVVQILKQESNVKKKVPRLIPFIADMRFRSRLEIAFSQYKPEIVFHAAAHKHVPLMELNQPEAITNNVLGTNNLLDLALEYQVQNFVMISTDKAVNPTNVMGASKRVAEMLVLQAAKRSGKPFVVVRFGNVLGSRGSVVPTFKRQIAKGGPVTITHPEISRYFMTIPEAVQLVLQAAVVSHRGEIFMLNMGQPVKIVDLAKDLIRLSGYELGKDIEIIFTGLRAGEKLHEELFLPGEEYEPTQHQKLLVVKNASQIIPENLELTVAKLCRAAANNDTNLILFLLEQLVSGYKGKYIKPEKSIPIRIKQQLPPSNSSNLAKLENNTNITNIFSVPKTTEPQLREALAQEELCLYYQPVVALKTGAIAELEALVRWQHPHWGTFAPIKFIPLAEATGLIIPMTYWLIESACRQLSFWQQKFPEAIDWSVSINISSTHLLQPTLIKPIEQNLAKYNLQPQNLKLEIAENLIRENPHWAIALIPQLRSLGVRLQIDNFGRSCSLYDHAQPNLLYKQFDRLKIDRYLVSRIDRDAESLEIVKSIFTTAAHSDLEIVATGIETLKHLNELRAMECHYGQGYLFSQPLPGEDVPKLIEIDKPKFSEGVN